MAARSKEQDFIPRPFSKISIIGKSSIQVVEKSIFQKYSSAFAKITIKFIYIFRVGWPCLNSQIKTLKRQAYGFRDLNFFKLRIMAIHQAKYALTG